MNKNLLTIPLAMALSLFAANSAMAGTVTLTFDFNSLGSGASSSAIKTYMQGVLGGYGTVSTVSAGTTTDRTYNGDGHVVGPGTTSVTSVTLGTSDGSTQHLSSYDTFLRNVAGQSSFAFTFSGLSVTGVAFDYEIFPDGSCTSLTSTGCGGAAVGGIYPSQPDFKFTTNLGNVFTYYSKTPGTSGGSTYVESPCTDGSSLTTGVSCVGTTERAPQLIGTTALLTTNVAGASTFSFIDWPAAIGIDNFSITFTTPPVGTSAVPEPASMLLLGTGLAVIARRRKRNKA